MTTPIKCPRCDRPFRKVGEGNIYLECDSDRYEIVPICDLIASAYARGIARGVEIAKEHVSMDAPPFPDYADVSMIDWSDVDRVVAGEIGK